MAEAPIMEPYNIVKNPHISSLIKTIIIVFGVVFFFFTVLDVIISKDLHHTLTLLGGLVVFFGELSAILLVIYIIVKNLHIKSTLIRAIIIVMLTLAIFLIYTALLLEHEHLPHHRPNLSNNELLEEKN